MTNRTVTEKPLTDQDFQALAAFRAALRQFVRFSEEAAREAGLTPQPSETVRATRDSRRPKQLLKKWWRRRESNPRPKMRPNERLRV